MSLPRFGFIGAGNMGGALMQGVLAAGWSPDRLAYLELPGRQHELLDAAGVERMGSLAALIDGCEILVLAVKPQLSGPVLQAIDAEGGARRLLLSIAAGLDCQFLSEQAGGARVIRAMPNTPVAVGEGLTGLYAPDHVTADERSAVTAFFGAVGQVVQLVSEDQMDGLTAMSGSGPAYVFRLVEALDEAVASQGFTGADGRLLVRQTLRGALALLEDSEEAPGTLRQKVTSPAGTTEAGLLRLEQADPDALFKGVLKAAADRSRALREPEPAPGALAQQQAIEAHVNDLLMRARPAAQAAARLSSKDKAQAIEAAAQALEADRDVILAANRRDIEIGEASGLSAALMDRLSLEGGRLDGVIADLRAVGQLPDPAGAVLEERSLRQGLKLQKVAVPIGTLAVIYESRPNVTVDAAGLAIRSGNAVILRGGKEAMHSSAALVTAIRRGLETAGFQADMVQLVREQSRALVPLLLEREGELDLVVPRGGHGLIRAVVETSRVPVIKHDKGVCTLYVHHDANLDMALDIALNGKVQRPGVCNAIENLLVHEDLAADFLPRLSQAMTKAGVELRTEAQTQALMPGARLAGADEWQTEYLDLILAVKVVGDLEQAIDFIDTHGSQHSDAIVTEDPRAAEQFLRQVDSAAVYHNASTRFTDGAMFGLGAEVGISTNRLHARGPMGLAELCTYKYRIHGTGQIRE